MTIDNKGPSHTPQKSWNLVPQRAWKEIYEYAGAPWPYTVESGYMPPDNSSRCKSPWEDFHMDLNDRNVQMTSHIYEMFKDNLNLNLSNCAITLTGSDGRREKRSPQSPFEFVVIETPNPLVSFTQEPPTVNPTVKKIEALIAGNSQFDQEIQSHVLSPNSDLLTYTGSKGRLVIPSRALETIPLYGSPQVIDQFKKQAVMQFKNLSPEDIRNFNKNFFDSSATALKQCVSGKNTEPVDLKTGKLTYNPPKRQKIKFVLLRPIQYKLQQALMSLAKDLPEKMLLEMPINIPDRINWLYRNNMLNLTCEEKEALTAAYSQSLEWYLHSQDEFENSNITETFVDPEQLQTVVTTISKFFAKEEVLKLPRNLR